jgi:hypothetical protein
LAGRWLTEQEIRFILRHQWIYFNEDKIHKIKTSDLTAAILSISKTDEKGNILSSGEYSLNGTLILIESKDLKSLKL